MEGRSGGEQGTREGGGPTPNVRDALTPLSPDLNPVDYSVWSVLQKRVCRTKISDVDKLKRRIKNECADPSHVDGSI